MLPNPFLKNRRCIYGIRSLDTGKIYVRRTKCLFSRAKQYLNAYHKDSSKHLNQYLRAAFNKYGADRFEIFPLEFCEIGVQKSKELQWMDRLQSYNREYGYNLRRDSEGGMQVCQTTSEKISKRLKKEWASGAREDHAQKMRDKWSNDQCRRNNQSRLLSRIKTKWKYNITHPNGDVERNVFFARLKELKITGVQANFYRNKADISRCKGYIIERFPA